MYISSVGGLVLFHSQGVTNLRMKKVRIWCCTLCAVVVAALLCEAPLTAKAVTCMQSLGVEVMHTGNHVVGTAIYHLLRQVEGTETMPLWVHKKSKLQAVCWFSCSQKGCQHLWCFHPSLLAQNFIAFNWSQYCTN